MKETDPKPKFVSVVFIALLLCSIFAGVASAESISENLSDNTILTETGDSDTPNLSDDYSLSSEIDSFLDANKPVFVFFYADWCHFCEEQKPVIDELEQEYADKIAFIRINAEENPQAMNEFGVTGFPAMFFIIDRNEEGYVYHEFDGFTDEETLKQYFNYVLENGSLLASSGISSFHTDQKEMGNLSIVIQENVTLAEFKAELANDIEFKELYDYAAELGYVYPSRITKTTYDNGVTITAAMMISDDLNQFIFLNKVCSNETNTSLLIQFDDTNITIFNKDGGTTINSDGAISSYGAHHSCSFAKCYENCIVEKFEYSFLEIEKILTDVAIDCLGKKGGDEYMKAYSYAKTGKCVFVCGTAETPRETGRCVRCAIQQTIGKIPAAKCVLRLWSILGDLLEPHADCIAECAAESSTWEENWGHPCRDHQDYMSKCSAAAGGKAISVYECRDCEWRFWKLRWCEVGETCVEIAPGHVACKKECTQHDCKDNDPCTVDWCTAEGECRHSREPGCCFPPDCNDGDPCTVDGCDPDGGCRHARKPGCDKPDDSFDVSTLFLGNANETYKDPEIGVLSNGFSPFFLNLLTKLDESGALIDVSLEGMENYSVFVIPSGGLAGLDSSPTFKSRLEQYVKDGGTLIVFSQQHGYELSAIPGNVSGYGWLEDQSCHFASVGISTYHPILSGQGSTILNANVDGFFTSYPPDSTILLLRTKNGMPAMLMYEYGKGTVIASTLYSDMATALYQGNTDETILIRDLIAWAKGGEVVETYAPGPANVSINVTNHYLGPLEYPVSEFDIGETINLSINVTNSGNISTDKVSFALFDPLWNQFWVNISETVQVNQSKLINLTYQTTDSSISGI